MEENILKIVQHALKEDTSAGFVFGAAELLEKYAKYKQLAHELLTSLPLTT